MRYRVAFEAKSWLSSPLSHSKARRSLQQVRTLKIDILYCPTTYNPMTAPRSVPTHKRTLAGGLPRRPNPASDYGSLLGRISKHYTPCRVFCRMTMYRISNDLIVSDRLATNEPQNPYQKRREQVRRAQKYVIISFPINRVLPVVSSSFREPLESLVSYTP